MSKYEKEFDIVDEVRTVRLASHTQSNAQSNTSTPPPRKPRESSVSNTRPSSIAIVVDPLDRCAKQKNAETMYVMPRQSVVDNVLDRDRLYSIALPPQMYEETIKLPEH